MHLKIKDGSVTNIQGLDCWLPPVGYVLNILTGNLEKRAIISMSSKKSEQYWQREPLPDWYKRREGAEESKKQIDPEYFDPEMEKYRSQEWDRRLNGVWVMMNGKAVYLTGLYYMYLQWWHIDIGYPKFRIPDLEYYYFLQYCIEDPECMGMAEITKRRFGKTFRCGLFLYEYPSRMEEAYSGLQSKTGADAKKVFSKAIIKPFKKLPRFFRPEYDMSGGITPKSELRFQTTNVKGKKAEATLDVEELGSLIDFQSAEVVAYDGQKLHRYVADECGKVKDIDVYDRHDVARYCILDDEGKIIGKMLYTTTVEEMEAGGAAFFKLWKDSDQANKGENERTPSGLYRFFMPAHRTRNFDAYGYPDEEKTLDAILADRKSIEHNPRALSARKRKEPLTEAEAFRIDGSKCMFNSELLNNRIDFLNSNEVTERGNFQWEGGVKDSKVVWVKSKNGRWEIPRGFSMENPNNVIKRGNNFLPGNKLKFVSGVDPYDHDVTQDDSRASKAASFVLKKYNPLAISDPFNKAFVCKYSFRQKMASMMYDDILMQCVFFGCPLLYESNKPGIKKHFNVRGYGFFLIHLPGYEDTGIPSTPQNKQTLAEVTEEY
ncbi:MAG: hypothetical protein WKF91_03170, partial [Segetibacter sp.]